MNPRVAIAIKATIGAAVAWAAAYGIDVGQYVNVDGVNELVGILGAVLGSVLGGKSEKASRLE